jgi:hypothetical protein
MRKISGYDYTPIDQCADFWECVQQSIIKVLNSPADEPLLLLLPWMNDIGVQAPATTKIFDVTPRTLPAHGYQGNV